MAEHRGRLEALLRVPHCGLLWLLLCSPACCLLRALAGSALLLHSCLALSAELFSGLPPRAAFSPALPPASRSSAFLCFAFGLMLTALLSIAPARNKGRRRRRHAKQ